MFGVLEWGYVLALLSACLIALILVLVARREAAAVRRQAIDDSRELRDQLRDRSAEVTKRQNDLHAQENELLRERRALRRQRQRVLNREEELDAKVAAIEQRQADAENRIVSELEAISGLRREEAVAELKRRVADEAHRAAAMVARDIELRARADAEERARSIVLSAIERVAVPTSSAAAVTTVALPSEDMRGRIIGKEGRNIRTFEATSGVDVLVEDNSSVVALASFDPERREVAATAMAELVADGRINPQRIEEALARARSGLAARTFDRGRTAAHDLGIHGLNTEILEVMGALMLRTSYGQSVLDHCIEVGYIAAAIAESIGADIDLAKRAGFLHDLGKAFTGDASGTHARVGSEFLASRGEEDSVVSIVAAHHDEIPHASIESVIVQIADAISAARPGARRDEAEHLIERMESLESLALAFPGVSKALAMAAGRELRVVVEPAEVPDDQVPAIARKVARAIEQEAGRATIVTVTVIKELRAVATSVSHND